MKDEEIRELRKEYERLLEIKKEILGYKKRKEELEETPEVMEYLKLCKIIASGEGYSFYGIEKLTDNQILDKVIDKFQSEEDNNIYTYIGKDSDGNYLKFKNIETFAIRNIKKEDIDEFEKQNIVMYPSGRYTADEFFEKMRKEYYEKIVDNYSDRCAKEHAMRRSYLFNRKH